TIPIGRPVASCPPVPSAGAGTTERRIPDMELRIGIVDTPKELTVEMDGSADDVVKLIETALGDGSPRAMLWLVDVKGRRIGAPADKIAYIELEENGATKHVGFGR